MTTTRVAVIGAGIIGLTTARALQKKGAEVVVVSKHHGKMTTSAVAGGFWMPFHCEPADKVIHWSRETLAFYEAEENDLIEKMPAFCLFASPEAPPGPEWGPAANLQLINGREALEEAMKSNDGIVAPTGYESAWRFQTVVVDSPKYLMALEEELVQNGAELHIEGFEIHGDLSSLAKELNCQVIVNCTGLNGGDVAYDEAISMPGRGAVAYYQRPPGALKAVVTAEDGPLAASETTPAYCIPRGDVVVVGGSYNLGEHSLDVTDAELKRIKINANAYSPMYLGHSEPFRVVAGLRPVRCAGVRLEVKSIQGGVTIAHNYGHGGSGWTTAWGCAHELANLILQTS